jgi:hypothetical protein
MCGSSGGGQLKPLTTSTTTADPRAQAMYQQALGTAQQASQTPFQRYSTDPRAFVAQLTPTQQQAISNIAQSQGVYQPYYGAAAGLAGGAGTTSTADVVGQYMSPYMQQVVDPVRAALQQQQGMQLSQQQAEAIKGGAFGGERAGLQRAALRGQQQLGMGQALSPLYQTGYGQALGAAQGDLSRQLQAGQLFGQLGTGAQTAALQGAQGLLGAGTLQQQTEQAGKQALYNQYLMERGYPFQTSQFLTSAAAGLGPLYGGTTTEQQAVNPFGMFLSDPRAKTGVDREEPDVVGKLNDGQNVYAYKYAAGGPAQIGLMADEVAQRYPEAVGQRPDGLMAVDYGKATEVPAAMSSGLGAARMGGAVTDGGDYARGGYAIGGHLSYVDPNDPGASDRRRMDALLSSHRSGTDTFVPTKMDIPTGSVQASQGLQPARMSGGQRQQSEGLAGLLGKGAKIGESAASLYKTYDFFKDKFKASGGPTSLDIPTGPIQASRGLEPARISDSGREEEDDGILGGLSKAADIGSKLAGIGTFAMKAAPFVMSLSDPRAKTGVRHGYADRGAVPAEDDIFERGLLGAESAHRQFDREGRTLTSPKGALGIAQIMPGTAPEAAKLAGLDYDPVRLRQDSEYNKALGKAYFDEQRRRFGSDELAAAAYNAGPGAVQKALRRAEATGQDVMSFLPAETRAYVPKVLGRGDTEGRPLAYTAMDRSAGEGGLGAINRVADRGSLRADAGEAPSAAAPAPAGLGAAKPTEEPGFMDKYAREEYIVPGLVGLAGAVEGALSAPTTSLGAALARGAATGVGAGAKAYEDIQTALPSREKTRAEAGETKARGLKEGAETLDKLRQLPITTIPGTRISIITLANGQPKLLSDWLESGGIPMGFDAAQEFAESLRQQLKGQTQAGYSPEGGFGGADKEVGRAVETAKSLPSAETAAPEKVGAPALGAPIGAKPSIIAPVGIGYTPSSDKFAKQEVRAVTQMGGESAEKRSDAYKSNLEQAASAAAPSKMFQLKAAALVSRANRLGGLDAPGLAADERSKIISGINTLSRSLGLKDANGNPVEFGSSDSTTAMLNKIAVLNAEAIQKNLPTGGLGQMQAFISAMPSTGQSPETSAFNAASNLVNTQKPIDKNNHADYYGTKSNGYYIYHDRAFSKDNPTAAYTQQEKAWQNLIMNPKGEQIIERILSDPQQYTPEVIEDYLVNVWKMPKGMSRFFVEQ